MFSRHFVACMAAVVACAVLICVDATRFNVQIKSTTDTESDLFYETPECLGRTEEAIASNPACYSSSCHRIVRDGAFQDKDITDLLSIAKKGMDTRGPSPGGPTILDINTGYVRDTNGLDNLFARENRLYSDEDFATYGRIISQLKGMVEESFGVSGVHFTAPTFITRLNAGEGERRWEPQEMHDEYWHVHADMNNTAHYQYSGLLYLSTYERDFTGGRLVFVQPDQDFEALDRDDLSPVPTHIIEPVAGRVAIFSSGPENPHYVERLVTGERFVLAFWFTCHENKKFEIFLDGQSHYEFSRRVGSSYSKAKRRQQEAQGGEEL